MSENSSHIFKKIADRGGYLTVPELACLLNKGYGAAIKAIQRGVFTKIRQVKDPNGYGLNGKVYQVHIDDPGIPTSIRIDYNKTLLIDPQATFKPDIIPGKLNPLSPPDSLSSFNLPTEEECEAIIYSEFPLWRRKEIDRKLAVIRSCEGLKGYKLRSFIVRWNKDNQKSKNISYSKVLRWRKRYEEQGIGGLISGHGKRLGDTKIKDDWLENYKSIFLKEGRPSWQSCYVQTFGYARSKDPGLTLQNFPSTKSFIRKLRREIPESAIYMARHGESAWNRKFANYLVRDYSNIKAGECWVSDHAQLDVMVRLPNGKYCFPWITAWCDFKTGKILGCFFHAEPPNADHILQAFFLAAIEYGLPTDVITDNGKDYLCRDLGGGRKKYKLETDEERMRSLFYLLGITLHLAQIRNAQAKIIERIFKKTKEGFSVHMTGYRGGNVTERPEILAKEEKLSWKEIEDLFEDYIENVLNKMPSKGKVLRGKSPDELWGEEFTLIRKVSMDALKLCCMRTSRDITIMRNGARDSEIGFSYWAEWMSGMKGTKIYLRRNPKAYQEAWVFRADNHEYLGQAHLADLAPALAKTDIEKARVKELMASKKRDRKTIQSFIEIRKRPSPEEKLQYMVAGVAGLNEARGFEDFNKKEVKVIKIVTNPMDEVVRKERVMGKAGTLDFSEFIPPETKEEKIFLWESDMPTEQKKNYEAKRMKGGII